MSDFAVLLNRLRIRAGLSQNALARAAGCDPAYVNRMERERDVPPSRRIVLALADALGLEPRMTDRLLYTAGYAPTRDYQTLWEAVEPAVEVIRRAVDGETNSLLMWRPA